MNQHRIMNKQQALTLARRYKAAVAERLPVKAVYMHGTGIRV